MKQTIKGRIFLVGCPRSGTTLLQALLSAHPQIASFPETQFFMDLVEQYDRRMFGVSPLTASERFNYFLSDCRVWLGVATPTFRTRVNKILEDFGRPDLKKVFPWKGRFIKDKVNAFLEILDQLAIEQDKEFWLEKSPNHLSYIDIIERFVPKPKFIHIIRNGADSVASIYDAVKKYPEWGPRYDYSLDKCIDRWIIAVGLTQKYIHKKNHALVRYERLVEDPQSVLAELSAFIGIEYDDKMLQEYNVAAKHLVLDSELWKGSVYQKIQNANSKKFYEVFDEEQRQHVLNRISQVKIS